MPINLVFIIVCALLLLYVAERITSICAERANRKERADLYSRIQSGTLTDYAANMPYMGGVVQPEEDEVEGADVTYSSQAPSIDTDTAINAFGKLMGS